MTVLQALRRTHRDLLLAGCPDAMVDAEMLLCTATGWKRHRLYLDGDRELGPDSAAELERMLGRRRAREPLQHIIGEVGFLDSTIITTPSALIPRPETEALVELLATALSGTQPALILDLGTGAGPIAVSVAARFPRAMIVATDVSIRAIELARQNLARNGVENVQLVVCSMLDALRARFDALVANPPYVPTALIEQLEPEVRLGDPRIALDGGPDGLRVLSHIAGCACSAIRPGGVLALETGEGQSALVAGMLSREGCWEDVRLGSDLAGTHRFVMARRLRDAKN
ncbi:peptide chain release factor N(5)-glutamine methyltransferase [Candidatus Fermentibacterales bacterium]|nr:peptide chain release factor N(5)-glutamine methyltransferase [Candidatus Fermentibacterales bacterium]